jgi:hypothetical protein
VSTGSVRVSRHRFTTRGKHRGTTVTFRLNAPAKVVLTVLGPSPSCGVAGTKAVHGRRGLNRVRLNGRFGDHTLAPGTYQIVVAAKRGSAYRRVGRISIQVVPPGSRIRRTGSEPVFFCTPSVAQTGIPGAGLFVSPPGKNRSSPSARKSQRGNPPPGQAPGRSGVLAEPPFHIGTGHGGIDLVLALLLYGTLGIGGAVLIVYLVRFLRGSWSP